MKFKYMQAAVAGLMLFVCNIANAALITETWFAEIYRSTNNDFQAGDTISWSVIYEKDSIDALVYKDGDDGIANTADDVVSGYWYDDTPELYQLAAFTQLSMFEDIFAQLKSGATNRLLPTDTITDLDHNSINYSVVSISERRKPAREVRKMRDAYEFHAFVNSSGLSAGNAMYAYRVNDETQNHFSFIEFLVTSVSTTAQPASEPVPEPSTLAIFALGIAGLIVRRSIKS